MLFNGVLKKMQTELADDVQYFLSLPDDVLHVNQLIDQTIELKFGGYQCLNCGKDKRIFRQGFCYDCFYESPMTGDWIMKPELSTAHLGQEDRDLDFEKKVQLQPHIVYLANSSHVKVGVTRKSQIPTRWIDQGAHEALPILETPNRHLAGVAEVALKEHISDKTNWRNMLKNRGETINLTEIRTQLENELPEEVREFVLTNEATTRIKFPVMRYPDKVKSFSFKKKTHYSGVLKGIKGQYLIFADNTVFNVRSNSGYICELGIASKEKTD